MSIGAAITNAKEKYGYRDFSKMANSIGIPSSTLLRLSKIDNKEDMKLENIEVLEKISNYLGMTINELINFKMEERNLNNNIEILNINETCDDVGIIIHEIKQKVKQDNIKIDGVLMTDESKQLFVDSLDITLKLTKNKL